jgi:hypothetical protein
MDLKVSQCKGCGAEIVWVLSQKTGTPQPLDAKPQRGVKVRIGEDNVARGTVEEFYTPHHATCPKVDQFRKRGGNGQ